MKIVNLNMVKYVFATTFKAKHFEIASFSFFCQTSPEYRGNRRKKSNLQTFKQLILFSYGLFFFWTCGSEVKFSK